MKIQALFSSKDKSKQEVSLKSGSLNDSFLSLNFLLLLLFIIDFGQW